MARTMIDLDDDLVAAAREALGTGTKRDTVHAALKDVVRRHAAREYLDWMATDPLPDLRNPAVMDGAWT